MRILVIEDHEDIAANIMDYLESDDHQCDLAHDGIGGLHLALSGDYDAIVLDLMLPGMDGLTLCRKLREAGHTTPILMLTARDTLDDKLEGFDMGADDYLVKPFALQELEARLTALTRRGTLKTGTVLRLADLEINLGAMEVTRAGKAIELNKTAISILRILVEASPNLVKRQDLIYKLWKDFPPGSDALRSHIYTLRQAVDKPFEQTLIHTVRGVGYRIVPPDA